MLALDLTSASMETVLVAEALVMTDSARATIVHACQPPYESMLIPVEAMGTAVPEYVDGWSHAALLEEIAANGGLNRGRHPRVFEMPRRP